MHTRFLVPVMVATALHALVLLVSHRPSHSVAPPPPVEKTVIREVIFTPKEEEPPAPIADAETEAPQAKGEREALRPTSEEPPPSPRLDNVFEMAAVKLPPSAGVAKIVPGAYGDPNGTGDAWMARPVLSYAMLDNSPRTRAQAAPVYPSEARRQGLAGEVWVEFMVDEDGRVLNPRVVRSSEAMFESATLNAVLKWRFEPGRKGGKPVRFRMVAPVVFGLDA